MPVDFQKVVTVLSAWHNGRAYAIDYRVARAGPARGQRGKELLHLGISDVMSDLAALITVSGVGGYPFGEIIFQLKSIELFILPQEVVKMIKGDVRPGTGAML